MTINLKVEERIYNFLRYFYIFFKRFIVKVVKITHCQLIRSQYQMLFKLYKI
jgi:hypothetical protein